MKNKKIGTQNHRTGVCLPTEILEIDTGTVEFRREAQGIMVLVNGVPSSFLDSSNPQHLEFEYLQHIDLLAAPYLADHPDFTALHLGAAGCCLANSWCLRYPSSRQVAVDIDAKLIRLVRTHLCLPRKPYLRLRAGEAYQTLRSIGQSRFSVVIRDVFSGITIPKHLREVSTAREVSRVLKTEGLYLVNTSSPASLSIPRAELKALSKVFPELVVVGDPAVLRGTRVGNLIIGASHHPWNLDSIDIALRRLALPTRRLNRETQERWLQD